MTNEELKFKLKKGKRYKTRLGYITEPLTIDKSTNYIYVAKINDGFATPSVRCWLSSGRYLSNSIRSKHDLIEEIQEDEKL